MPQTQMNINLANAITDMKKHVVSNGGSCFFIIVNDGEVMQNGGGQSDMMKELLKNTITAIDADSGAIIKHI